MQSKFNYRKTGKGKRIYGLGKERKGRKSLTDRSEGEEGC